METFAITAEHIIGILVSAAFGLWAWVVRQFGVQHLRTIQEMAADIKQMKDMHSREMFEIRDRLNRLEIQMEYFSRMDKGGTHSEFKTFTD